MKSVKITRAFLAVAALGILPYEASADPAKELETKIDEITGGGKVNLDVRARYEYNDQNATTNARLRDINGYTARTRLGFTSGVYEGFQGMVEMENVSAIDDDTTPLLDVPPVGGDSTELNQLWISYQYEKLAKAKAGRQVLFLDDHRFIGHVGWRQNIQTFDAAVGTFTPVEKLTATAGYLSRVNRVNFTNEQMDSFILNGKYTVEEWLNVSAFGYIVDMDRPVAVSALRSSSTYGSRLTGSKKFEDITVSYAGSYAKQFDLADGENFDHNYYAADLSAKFMDITGGSGFEILQGDGTSGFSTPLATVHAFNGYADVFAAPSINGSMRDGLLDYYFYTGYKVPVGNGIDTKATYHFYETTRNAQDLGEEINLEASYKINKYLSLVTKYAWYDAEDGVTAGYGNFDKTVFTFEMNFKL